MSDAMSKAERLQDAARYAEELVTLQPLPEPLLMAACAMSRIGNANRALSYLEQSLRACPSESLSRIMMMMIMNVATSTIIVMALPSAPLPMDFLRRGGRQRAKAILRIAV